MTKTTIHKTCLSCNDTYQLKVFEKDLIRIHQGEHIQDVMPYLTADDRELMISGICGICFDEMCADEN